MTAGEDASAAGAPPRTLGREFTTGRSLGLLVLFLLLAGVFAGLMQWQLSRAIEAGTVQQRPTETVLPLTRVAQPGEQQTDASVGQSVRTTGQYVPEDVVLAGDRLNRGERGWWVVAHAVVDEPEGAQLAVAVGWARTREQAEDAATAMRSAVPADQTLVGRYVDSDGAEPTASGDPAAPVGVSTARLVNLWSAGRTGPVYEGVLTLRQAPAGLTSIYSPTPGEEVELNLLNLLYAAEWALFALFALYIWYRLVRDRWELGQRSDEDAEQERVSA